MNNFGNENRRYADDLLGEANTPTAFVPPRRAFLGRHTSSSASPPNHIFRQWPAATQAWLKKRLTWAEFEVFLWDDEGEEFEENTQAKNENSPHLVRLVNVYRPPTLLTLLPPFHCPLPPIQGSGGVGGGVDLLSDDSGGVGSSLQLSLGGDKLQKMFASEFAARVLVRRNELQAMRKYETAMKRYDVECKRREIEHAEKYQDTAAIATATAARTSFLRLGGEGASPSTPLSPSAPPLTHPPPPPKPVITSSVRSTSSSFDADTGELTRVVASLKSNTNWVGFLQQVGLSSVSAFNQVLFAVAERTALWRAELWYARTQVPLLLQTLERERGDKSSADGASNGSGGSAHCDADQFLARLKASSPDYSPYAAFGYVKVGGEHCSLPTAVNDKVVGGGGEGGIATAGKLYVEPFKQILKEAIPVLDLPSTIATLLPSVASPDETATRLDVLVCEMQRYGVWFGEIPTQPAASASSSSSVPTPQPPQALSLHLGSDVYYKASLNDPSEAAPDCRILGGAWTLGKSVTDADRNRQVFGGMSSSSNNTEAPTSAMGGDGGGVLCVFESHEEQQAYVEEVSAAAAEAARTGKPSSANLFGNSNRAQIASLLRQKRLEAEKMAQNLLSPPPPFALHPAVLVTTASTTGTTRSANEVVDTHRPIDASTQQRLCRNQWVTVSGGNLMYAPLSYRQPTHFIVRGGEGANLYFPALLCVTAASSTSADLHLSTTAASHQQQHVIASYRRRCEDAAIFDQRHFIELNTLLFPSASSSSTLSCGGRATHKEFSPMKRCVRQVFVALLEYCWNEMRSAMEAQKEEKEKEKKDTEFVGSSRSSNLFEPPSSPQHMNCTIKTYSFYENYCLNANPSLREGIKNRVQKELKRLADAFSSKASTQIQESEQKEKGQTPDSNKDAVGEAAEEERGAQKSGDKTQNNSSNEKGQGTSEEKKERPSCGKETESSLRQKILAKTSHPYSSKSFSQMINFSPATMESMAVVVQLMMQFTSSVSSSPPSSSQPEKACEEEKKLSVTETASPDGVVGGGKEQSAPQPQQQQPHQTFEGALCQLVSALTANDANQSWLALVNVSAIRLNEEASSPAYELVAKTATRLHAHVCERIRGVLGGDNGEASDSGMASNNMLLRREAQPAREGEKERETAIQLRFLFALLAQSVLLDVRDAHNTVTTRSICTLGKQLVDFLMANRALPGNLSNTNFLKKSDQEQEASKTLQQRATAFPLSSKHSFGFGQGYDSVNVLTSAQRTSYFGVIFNNIRDLLRLRHKCMKLSSLQIQQFNEIAKSRDGALNPMGAAHSNGLTFLSDFDNIERMVIESHGWVPLKTVLIFINFILAKGGKAFENLFADTQRLLSDSPAGGGAVNLTETAAENSKTLSNAAGGSLLSLVSSSSNADGGVGKKKNKKKKSGSASTLSAGPVDESFFIRIRSVTEEFFVRLLSEHDLMQRYEIGKCTTMPTMNVSASHTTEAGGNEHEENGGVFGGSGGGTIVLTENASSPHRRAPFEGQRCVRVNYAHEDLTSSGGSAPSFTGAPPLPRRNLFQTIFDERPRLFASLEDEQRYYCQRDPIAVESEGKNGEKKSITAQDNSHSSSTANRSVNDDEAKSIASDDLSPIIVLPLSQQQQGNIRRHWFTCTSVNPSRRLVTDDGDEDNDGKEGQQGSATTTQQRDDQSQRKRDLFRKIRLNILLALQQQRRYCSRRHGHSRRNGEEEKESDEGDFSVSAGLIRSQRLTSSGTQEEGILTVSRCPLPIQTTRAFSQPPPPRMAYYFAGKGSHKKIEALVNGGLGGAIELFDRTSFVTLIAPEAIFRDRELFVKKLTDLCCGENLDEYSVAEDGYFSNAVNHNHHDYDDIDEFAEALPEVDNAQSCENDGCSTTGDSDTSSSDDDEEDNNDEIITYQEDPSGLVNDRPLAQNQRDDQPSSAEKGKQKAATIALIKRLEKRYADREALVGNEPKPFSECFALPFHSRAARNDLPIHRRQITPLPTFVSPLLEARTETLHDGDENFSEDRGEFKEQQMLLKSEMKLLKKLQSMTRRGNRSDARKRREAKSITTNRRRRQGDDFEDEDELSQLIRKRREEERRVADFNPPEGNDNDNNRASNLSPSSSTKQPLAGYIANYIVKNLDKPDEQHDEKLKGHISLTLFEVDLYALAKDHRMVVKQLPDREVFTNMSASKNAEDYFGGGGGGGVLNKNACDHQSVVIEGHFLAMPSEFYQSDDQGRSGSKRLFPSDFFTGRKLEITQTTVISNQPHTNNTKDVKVRFSESDFLPFYFVDDCPPPATSKSNPSSSAAKANDSRLGADENKTCPRGMVIEEGKPLVPLRNFSPLLAAPKKINVDDRRYIFGHRMLRKEDVTPKYFKRGEEEKKQTTSSEEIRDEGKQQRQSQANHDDAAEGQTASNLEEAEDVSQKQEQTRETPTPAADVGAASTTADDVPLPMKMTTIKYIFTLNIEGYIKLLDGFASEGSLVGSNRTKKKSVKTQLWLLIPKKIMVPTASSNTTTHTLSSATTALAITAAATTNAHDDAGEDLRPPASAASPQATASPFLHWCPFLDSTFYKKLKHIKKVKKTREKEAKEREIEQQKQRQQMLLRQQESVTVTEDETASLVTSSSNQQQQQGNKNDDYIPVPRDLEPHILLDIVTPATVAQYRPSGAVAPMNPSPGITFEFSGGNASNSISHRVADVKTLIHEIIKRNLRHQVIELPPPSTSKKNALEKSKTQQQKQENGETASDAQQRQQKTSATDGEGEEEAVDLTEEQNSSKYRDLFEEALKRHDVITPKDLHEWYSVYLVTRKIDFQNDQVVMRIAKDVLGEEDVDAVPSSGTQAKMEKILEMNCSASEEDRSLLCQNEGREENIAQNKSEPAPSSPSSSSATCCVVRQRHRFAVHDVDIYRRAITRQTNATTGGASSSPVAATAEEGGGDGDYEQLEFIGDTLLDYCTVRDAIALMWTLNWLLAVGGGGGATAALRNSHTRMNNAKLTASSKSSSRGNGDDDCWDFIDQISRRAATVIANDVGLSSALRNAGNVAADVCNNDLLSCLLPLELQRQVAMEERGGLVVLDENEGAAAMEDEDDQDGVDFSAPPQLENNEQHLPLAFSSPPSPPPPHSPPLRLRQAIDPYHSLLFSQRDAIRQSHEEALQHLITSISQQQGASSLPQSTQPPEGGKEAKEEAGSVYHELKKESSGKLLALSSTGASVSLFSSVLEPTFRHPIRNLGKNASTTAINTKTKADMLEALFGAVYEDGSGLDGVRRMCLEIFPKLNQLSNNDMNNESTQEGEAPKTSGTHSSSSAYSSLCVHTATPQAIARARQRSAHAILFEIIERVISATVAASNSCAPSSPHHFNINAEGFDVDAQGDAGRISEACCPRPSKRSDCDDIVDVNQLFSEVFRLLPSPSISSSSSPSTIDPRIVSRVASYCFTPFDCRQLVVVDDASLDAMAHLFISDVQSMNDDPSELLYSGGHFDGDDADDEESERKRQELWRQSRMQPSSVDEEVLKKTGGGIIFYVTDNAHGSSAASSRIQDKSYATHFTTGSVYSYRRAEHYLFAPHLVGGGGGFSGNASSGFVMAVTAVLRRHFYGDISFMNETIVLPFNTRGILMTKTAEHKSQRAKIASSSSSSPSVSLTFPTLPSPPFVPFTIDFDGMAITSHQVDNIMTKYLSKTFYSTTTRVLDSRAKQAMRSARQQQKDHAFWWRGAEVDGENNDDDDVNGDGRPSSSSSSSNVLSSQPSYLRRALPLGGLVLDCTGQTQRRINGDVKIKYKHSCHVHFPSVVMSLDGLEQHTSAVRRFVHEEKLALYSRYYANYHHHHHQAAFAGAFPDKSLRFLLDGDVTGILKPGDVVKARHDSLLYLVFAGSEWAVWWLNYVGVAFGGSSDNGDGLVISLKGKIISSPATSSSSPRHRCVMTPTSNKSMISLDVLVRICSDFCDPLTLTALCFTNASCRTAACIAFIIRRQQGRSGEVLTEAKGGKGAEADSTPLSFAILRRIRINTSRVIKVDAIKWNSDEKDEKTASNDSICDESWWANSNLICWKGTGSATAPAAATPPPSGTITATVQTMPFTLIDKQEDLSEGVAKSEIPAAKYHTEIFNNIKETLLEKNPNTQHIWNKVIDSGLVTSKKLRMYLCDKYDQTYHQEFRPLQFERFLPFKWSCPERREENVRDRCVADDNDDHNEKDKKNVRFAAIDENGDSSSSDSSQTPQRCGDDEKSSSAATDEYEADDTFKDDAYSMEMFGYDVEDEYPSAFYDEDDANSADVETTAAVAANLAEGEGDDTVQTAGISSPPPSSSHALLSPQTRQPPRPFASVPHDQVIAMSSLQRAKVLDVFGDQHFVDDYRPLQTVEEQEEKEGGGEGRNEQDNSCRQPSSRSGNKGFNPLLPSVAHLLAFGPLLACESTNAATLLDATCPLRGIDQMGKGEGKGGDEVTKYAGIYPCYWVCIHHYKATDGDESKNDNSNVCATIAFMVGGQPVIALSLPTTELTAQMTLVKALNGWLLQYYANIFVPHVLVNTPMSSASPTSSGPQQYWTPKDILTSPDDSACVFPLLKKCGDGAKVVAEQIDPRRETAAGGSKNGGRAPLSPTPPPPATAVRTSIVDMVVSTESQGHTKASNTAKGKAANKSLASKITTDPQIESGFSSPESHSFRLVSDAEMSPFANSGRASKASIDERVREIAADLEEKAQRSRFAIASNASDDNRGEDKPALLSIRDLKYQLETKTFSLPQHQQQESPDAQPASQDGRGADDIMMGFRRRGDTQTASNPSTSSLHASSSRLTPPPASPTTTASVPSYRANYHARVVSLHGCDFNDFSTLLLFSASSKEGRKRKGRKRKEGEENEARDDENDDRSTHHGTETSTAAIHLRLLYVQLITKPLLLNYVRLSTEGPITMLSESCSSRGDNSGTTKSTTAVVELESSLTTFSAALLRGPNVVCDAAARKRIAIVCFHDDTYAEILKWATASATCSSASSSDDPSLSPTGSSLPSLLLSPWRRLFFPYLMTVEGNDSSCSSQKLARSTSTHVFNFGSEADRQAMRSSSSSATATTNMNRSLKPAASHHHQPPTAAGGDALASPLPTTIVSGIVMSDGTVQRVVGGPLITAAAAAGGGHGEQLPLIPRHSFDIVIVVEPVCIYKPRREDREGGEETEKEKTRASSPSSSAPFVLAPESYGYCSKVLALSKELIIVSNDADALLLSKAMRV